MFKVCKICFSTVKKSIISRGYFNCPEHGKVSKNTVLTFKNIEDIIEEGYPHPYVPQIKFCKYLRIFCLYYKDKRDECLKSCSQKIMYDHLKEEQEKYKSRPDGAIIEPYDMAVYEGKTRWCSFFCRVCDEWEENRFQCYRKCMEMTRHLHR